MPTKSNARREILPGVSQRLPVIAKSKVDSQIRSNFPIVLDKGSQQPLSEVIFIHAEIDRLRIILHVGQRQRTKGRRRRVFESKGAENRGAGLTAKTCRSMMRNVATKSKVMLPHGP